LYSGEVDRPLTVLALAIPRRRYSLDTNGMLKAHKGSATRSHFLPP
jgi:hypothetical protein